MPLLQKYFAALTMNEEAIVILFYFSLASLLRDWIVKEPHLGGR
jgi:hypothetical protein